MSEATLSGSATNVELSQLEASAEATVMLDIGGDMGALVIVTAKDLHLAEIEVSPHDPQLADDPSWSHSLLPHDHDHGHPHSHGHSHDHNHREGTTHVAVRERIGPTGVHYAAIFPGLRAGQYTVWGIDGNVRDTVTVTGGEVTQLNWR